MEVLCIDMFLVRVNGRGQVLYIGTDKEAKQLRLLIISENLFMVRGVHGARVNQHRCRRER